MAAMHWGFTALQRAYQDFARGIDDGIDMALDHPFVLWLVVFAVVLIALR